MMNLRIALAALIASTSLLSAQDAAVVALELKPSTDASMPLAYTTKELTCKAGSKVKLTVNNTGGVLPQPHNVVLCKPGTDNKVMAASMTMMTDPKGMEKAYIPESTDILAFTKFAQPNMSESVEFTAPNEAGDYPFFCTFPGHSAIMKGVLKITP
jgi:azurin